MKKILFLFAISFQFLTAQNNLSVFTEDGQRFYLILNGLKYNEQAQTNVKAVNLDQSAYKAKILFEDPRYTPVDANIYLMWEGKTVTGAEFTYAVVKNKKGKYSVKFISNNIATKEPDPIVPIQPVTSLTTSSSDSKVFGIVYNTYSGSPSFNNNVPGNGICYSAMTESDFAIACDVVEKAFTADEKLKTAETIVKMNCVNSSQVSKIARLITFEVDRLKFAKAAYPNMVDKNKAFVVADAFSFSSSKDDYLKFVNINSVPGSAVCKMAMAANSFTAAINSLKEKHHDSDKGVVAKQIIAGNCFSADQVKQMLQQFNFDSGRIEIAKEAFKKTIDKNNYFVVNDAFTSSSSVDELNKYMNSQR